MKSLTTDQALLERIRAYDQRRETNTDWKAEDEQILAFLMELFSRREYDRTIQTILVESENQIQTLFDRFQDEKNMLIQ